ncbi:MAG: hypothetical protein A3J47_01955 [Candidatus Yanofskybacteria bacterium RIFCSPHIGHO2_02_FULL_43_22]|uniref:EF-hand domain-containing protein n=1 Tax=Candidatus Yanofskybacteria bacterium RIFCSPHIGHO2_02_FULL_43_22 TaxID=1802681 RepID=A0A1F8FLG9_9BACT|nr:MAG: hypothetical protein A3J47_01955 [Candidatus Yanofskybacteria bacterium RIFCSPHIGHO2_02_FULL_43_22]
MPIKIKILVSFLGLVAVSLVYLGLKNLKVDLDLKPNQANINTPLERDADWDNDGLPNREESYWNTDPNKPDTDGDGYLDGEEVASGHDPLKPGPDDKMEKNNLTKTLSEIAFAGIAEGSLKPTSPKYVESLNMVVDGLFTQSEINLNPRNEISTKVVPDSYEAINIYKNTIYTLIESMAEKEGESILKLVDLIDDTNFFDDSKLKAGEKSFQNLHNFSLARAAELNRNIATLEAGPVPEMLSEQHRFIIKIFKSVSISYASLANADSDPIQAMLSFQNIIILFTERLPDKLTEYIKIMQDR